MKINESPERSKFIFKAIQKYGDKYNYAKVKFKNMRQKVIITCPIHGDFEISPYGHLKGNECPYCNGKKKEKAVKIKSTNVKKTNRSMKDRSIDAQKKFINKAKVLFPEYDYSKVDFLNKKDGKVCIICPIHGEFWVIPHNLIENNCSCNYCKGRVTNTEEFIYKANKIHKNKYNYSKVNFINYSTKVEILCPKHGSFYQRPNDHLSGNGCPHCRESNGEKLVEEVLNNLNIEYKKQYKLPQLLNNHKVIVDFYLLDYNIFIEYNGRQHYMAIDYFGGEERFKVQQERDQNLRNYCKLNNIKLIEIKYTEDTLEKIERIIKFSL